MVYLQIVRTGLDNLLQTENAFLKTLAEPINNYFATNDYLSEQSFAASGEVNDTLGSQILSQIRPT
jgi:hypothetical protein